MVRLCGCGCGWMDGVVDEIIDGGWWWVCRGPGTVTAPVPSENGVMVSHISQRAKTLDHGSCSNGSNKGGMTGMEGANRVTVRVRIVDNGARF